MSGARWTRRRALAAGVAGLAAAGTAAWVAKPAPGGPRDASAELLRRIVAHRAPYVRVRPGALQRFAEDYLADSRWRLQAALRVMRAPSLYGRAGLDGLAAGASGRATLAATERHVVTALLMGFGYFDPRAGDPGRGLDYLGWQRACANPFARRRLPG